MSLSSDGNQGYLDIRNAILRVGTLDVYGITGVDQVTNVVKQNSVLIWDDQGSDMTTPPFQKGAGVLRSTSPPEINLVDSAGNNFMYQGLKLPNSWQGEFDLYFADATEGAINCHFYTTSTTSYTDDGYELAFDRENSTVTLRYDATQVAQATGVSLSSTQWHTASVTFNRGAWAVALDAERVLTHDDDERSAVYDNTTGQYVRFETTATTDRKVRYIKFLNNGAPWLESNAGHLYNLSSNVAIGVSEDDYRFSVAGTANVGALTTTSVNVTGGVDATSVSTGDLTLTGLGVESNIHTSNLYASGYVGVGTESPEASLNVIGSSDLSGNPTNAIASFRASTANPGTSDAGVVIGSVNGNSPYIADVSSASLGLNFYTQNNKRMKIKSDGNVAIGTHDPQYKLDVAGTANVGAITMNSNVYAPNLPLAEVASNLVTWDSTTGDLMDSGGLISNKLAIVSEQPPAALTGDSTVVDGHGRYKVTSSSEGNEPNFGDWNCFNKATGGNNAWHTDVNYDLATGTHNNSAVTLGGVQGEWVKLELPYKTILRHIVLNARDSSVANRAPVDFTLLGSNDDSTWTSLLSIDGESYTAEENHTFAVNASAYYKYYALVVEKIGVTSQGNCVLGEWRLFTETFTVDAGVVSTTAASGLDVGYTEHPEPMRDYHTYVEGQGTYEASASSYDSSGSLYPWEAFDNNTSTRWAIGAYNAYNQTTGEWDQTAITNYPHVYTDDVGGTRYAGHWLQIKLPYAITLSHSNVYPTNTLEYRAPKDGVILGSNDGQNWYKLTQFTGKTYTSATWTRIDVNATTPYQYYRMCVTKVGTGTYQYGYVELTEWRLFAEKSVTRMENVHISGDLSSETLQTGYIKWPRVQLKANDSEGYVASASNVYNSDVSTAPYTAFNNYREVKSNGYADAFVGGNGDFTSGVANKSRTTGTDTFNHEWLQIQMPRAITLSYFTLLQRVKNLDNDNDMPKNGRMYGSNDGISWTKLVTFSDLTYERFEETRVRVNSTTPYSYYRLAVTETVGNAQVYVAVGELQLFEAATGVGTAPTSAKLQVAGSLGMAKGAEFFAGDDVVMELPKHDRPLTKYPEILLGGVDNQSLGGYVVSSSSTAFNSTGFYNSNVYNGIIGNEGWHTDTSTNASIGGVSGHWHKTEMPKAIKVKYFDVAARPGFTTDQAPRDFTILGSNDNLQWTTLKVVTNQTYTNYQYARVSVDATQYYKYFVFSIQSNAQGNSPNSGTTVGEIRWWGYEEGDTSVDVVHRSIPNKPGQQHLEVYWDANDSNSYSFANSSNVYDLSGNGVKGTITGNNGFDTEYNAWEFDGSGDYISGTLNTTTGAWVHSFSFWMNADTLGGSSSGHFVTLGAEADDSTSTIRFAGQDKFQWYFWGNDLRFDAPGTIGQWVHIVGTYDGGNDSGVSVGNFGVSRKIFINTKETTVIENVSGTAGSDPLNLTTTSTPFRIGTQLSGGAGFDGKIANVRVFSKKLSIEQIRELYEYDAERFGHRQNLMALRKGCLGVGVEHPTSRFEVAGADGVQEFPPQAMSDFETYMEGHGVFKARWSYWWSGNTPWGMYGKTNAVDYSASTVWYGPYDNNNGYTGGSVYSGTDYAASTTSGLFLDDVDGNRYYGAWTTIEMPYDIVLKRIHLYQGDSADSVNAKCIPEDGVILGSHNGSDWHHVHTFIGLTYGGSVGTSSFSSSGEQVVVNATQSYKHYALITTRTLHYAFTVIIGELYWYGTPAPSAIEDGHLTLGKALTLPRVSGHAAGAETPRAESLVVHYDTTVDSVVSGSVVVDISGEGANGTLTNGAGYSTTQRALYFDGVDDCVTGSIPSSMSGNHPYTFSLWIKPDAIQSGYIAIFEMGLRSNDRACGLYLNGGVIVHLAFANNLISTTSVVVNQWIHITGTYTSGSRKVYANGQLLTSDTYSSLNLGATTLTLGANNEYTQEFDGSISNFKLWDVALTAEEVAAEYALGRTGKSINLTDTALCLGGTVPRAQLDVRGSARFDGRMIIGKSDQVADDLADITPTLDVRGLDDTYIRAHCVATKSAGLILSEGTNNQFIMEYEGAGAGAGNYVAFYSGESGWPAGAKGLGLNYVPQSGNVGIGKTNPSVPFHIKQKNDGYPGSNNAGAIRFEREGNTNRWDVYHYSNGNLHFDFNGGGRGYVWDDGTDYVKMNFTGQHRTFIKDIPFSQAGDLEGLIVSANNNKYIKMSGGIEVGSNAITTNESLPVVSLSTKANDKKCFGVISASEDPEERSDKFGSFVTPYEKEQGDTRVYINSVGEGAMWVVNTAGPLESGDYITTSNVAGYGQRQDDDILHNYTVAKITMDCDFNPPDIPVQRILKELANVTYWYQLENATSNAYDRTQEETYYTKDRHVEVHGHVDEQSNVFVPPDHDLELYSKTQVNTVSEEVYNALPEDEQALYDSNTFTYTQVIGISPEVWSDLGVEEQNTYVHGYFNIVTDEVSSETPGAVERTRTVYKKVVNETKVEPATPEDYLSEVREEWVNILDEHDQIQFEDVPWGDTEPAYKLRYLDAEGQITTRHNAVHTAAFVGVTYHCG